MFPKLTNLFHNPQAAGKSAQPVGNHPLILVVDDSAMMRGLVTKILHGQGYHTIEADSGIAAIAEWETHKAQVVLVVSDIFMPGMDGLTLARHLRKRSSALQIILISSRITEDTQWVAEEAGLRCLQKPFKETDLLDAVREAFTPPKSPS
jgi:two-component system, cell cycle sensor histidine kinase and response regulator CckA